MPSEAFDPSKRRLCPDGACIGVIGSDGRCKECGRAASGAPVALVGSEASPRSDGPADSGDGDGSDDVREAAPTEAGDGGFDPSRRLCDDGACVGVVGKDGVCGVCGRRAEGS